MIDIAQMDRDLNRNGHIELVLGYRWYKTDQEINLVADPRFLPYVKKLQERGATATIDTFMDSNKTQYILVIYK